jgi:RHS repeat-associated protein
VFQPTETYTYDALQRLTASSHPGEYVAYAYTKSGNLTWKSDFGVGTNAYVYPLGKHGVTQVALPQGLTATYAYDANGNVIGGNTLQATYDPDNRLRVINRAYLLSGPGDKIFCNGFDNGTNTCTNPPGSGTTSWTYGTNGERSTEQSSQGLRYFGPDGYELIVAGTPTSKHELGPVLVSRTGGADSIAVVLRDRLGSPITTIDGAAATLRTYDAFGAARNGDMSPRHNGTLNLSTTIHGFTDHTHADDVGLIHMRGRVYDANLGRFLSVDPVVGDANSQSLNPCSYLANNPLSGTDPTGMIAVDMRSVCAKTFSACKNGAVAWTGSVSGGKSGGEQPHDRQSVTGPTSQAENKQSDDIRDGSRKSMQLAQAIEPAAEREAERDGETSSARAEASRARGVSPAVRSAVEAEASARLQESVRRMQEIDPNYRAPETIGAGGEANNPVDQLGQVRSELAARQAKFLSEVLPNSARSLRANPFAGKTTGEVVEMLESRGYVPKGPDPAAGRGTYLNPKTGRGYHIDASHPDPKGPHVGVHRPRDLRDTLDPRDYPMGDSR